MILEVKEIIAIDSVAIIREKFPNMERFSESELEETILSEPEVIISTVAKKAARIDPRYFVLLKTNESLLALHISLHYFLIITEDANKRIEVCLGKQNAEDRYIDYVAKAAIGRDVSKKYFENKDNVITYEYCQRIAPKLIEHGFEIELVYTK